MSGPAAALATSDGGSASESESSTSLASLAISGDGGDCRFSLDLLTFGNTTPLLTLGMKLFRADIVVGLYTLVAVSGRDVHAPSYPPALYCCFGDCYCSPVMVSLMPVGWDLGRGWPSILSLRTQTAPCQLGQGAKTLAWCLDHYDVDGGRIVVVSLPPISDLRLRVRRKHGTAILRSIIGGPHLLHIPRGASTHHHCHRYIHLYDLISQRYAHTNVFGAAAPALRYSVRGGVEGTRSAATESRS